MELDSSIAVVFRCFEDFLRKAGTLNLFETLVYNYRLKEESCTAAVSTSFSAILSELIQQLTSLRNELLEKRSCFITLDYLPILEQCQGQGQQQEPLETLFSLNHHHQNPVQNGVVEESTNSELLYIPILKEEEKRGEELSVGNVCDMLGVEVQQQHHSSTCGGVVQQQQVVEAPPQPLRADPPPEAVVKKKKKKKVVQQQQQQQQQQREAKPIERKEAEDELLFFCCDKCFHCFRTEERFGGHTCTGKGGGKPHPTPTPPPPTTNPGLRKMKKFVCGLCLEEYRNLDRISFHLKRCEGGPFTCEMCPTSAPPFTTMKSLNFHKIHEHKEERSFICRDCGFPFKFKCSLQKHKLRAHNTELQPRTFPCDLCPSVFLKKIFLTNHRVKSHGAERSSGSSNGAGVGDSPPPPPPPEKLKQESKLHPCPTCPKSFSKKSKLDDHFNRRHSASTATHPCPACSKTFRTRKDQRQHWRRMHSNITVATTNDGGGQQQPPTTPPPTSTPPPPQPNQEDPHHLMSDFMEELTPTQLQQIIQADFLVPTLIP